MSPSDPTKPFPHLPRAPITEALIDLRVDLPPTVGVSDFERLSARLGDEYPTKEERIEVQVDLDVQAGITREERRQLGLLFWSPDRLQALQARPDGFSFSRLKPYQNWASLRSDARRGWAEYSDVARPLRVTRAAVRYINRLELPVPLDFSEYLVTFPRRGDGLPHELRGLLMRLVSKDPTGMVSITEVIDERGATADMVPLILDIEAWRDVDLPAEGDEIWRVLDELRELKNRVFFGSVTKKTQEMFQ